MYKLKADGDYSVNPNNANYLFNTSLVQGNADISKQETYLHNGIKFYAYEYSLDLIKTLVQDIAVSPTAVLNSLNRIIQNNVFYSTSPIIYLNVDYRTLKQYFKNGTISQVAFDNNVMLGTLNSSGTLETVTLQKDDESSIGKFNAVFGNGAVEGLYITKSDVIAPKRDKYASIAQNIFYSTKPMISKTANLQNTDFYCYINGEFTNLRTLLKDSYINSSNQQIFVYNRFVRSLTPITNENVNVNYGNTKLKFGNQFVYGADVTLTELVKQTYKNLGLSEAEVNSSTENIVNSLPTNVQNATYFFTESYAINDNTDLSTITVRYQDASATAEFNLSNLFSSTDEISEFKKVLSKNLSNIVTPTFTYNPVSNLVILTGTDKYTRASDYISAINNTVFTVPTIAQETYIGNVRKLVEANGDSLKYFKGITPYLAHKSIETAELETEIITLATAIDRSSITLPTGVSRTDMFNLIQTLVNPTEYTLAKLQTKIGNTLVNENSFNYYVIPEDNEFGFKYAMYIKNSSIYGSMVINGFVYSFQITTFKVNGYNVFTFLNTATEYKFTTTQIGITEVPETYLVAVHKTETISDYSNVVVATTGTNTTGHFMHADKKAFNTLSATVSGRITLNAYFRGASYIMDINVNESDETYDASSKVIDEETSYNKDTLQETADGGYENVGFDIDANGNRFYYATNSDSGNKVQLYKLLGTAFEETDGISPEQLKSYIYNANGALLNEYSNVVVIGNTNSSTLNSLINQKTASNYIWDGNSYIKSPNLNGDDDYEMISSYRRNTILQGIAFGKLLSKQYALSSDGKNIYYNLSGRHPFADTNQEITRSIYTILCKTNDETRFNDGNYIIVRLKAEAINDYTLNSSISDINEYIIEQTGELNEDRIKINSSNSKNVQVVPIKTTDDKLINIKSSTITSTLTGSSTQFVIKVKVTATPSSGFPSIQVLLNGNVNQSATGAVNGLERNSNIFRAFYNTPTGLEQIDSTKFAYGSFKSFNNQIFPDEYGNVTSPAYNVRLDVGFKLKAIALEIDVNAEGESSTSLGYLNTPSNENDKNSVSYQNTQDLINKLITLASSGNFDEYNKLATELSNLFSNYSIYKFKGANYYLNQLQEFNDVIKDDNDLVEAFKKFDEAKNDLISSSEIVTIINTGLSSRINKIMKRELEDTGSNINIALKRVIQKDLTKQNSTIIVTELSKLNDNWQVTYNVYGASAIKVLTEDEIDSYISDLLSSISNGSSSNTFGINGEKLYYYYYLCALIERYTEKKFDDNAFYNTEGEFKPKPEYYSDGKYADSIITTIESYNSMLAVQDYLNNFSNYYNTVLYDLISAYSNYGATSEQYRKVAISAFLAYGLVFNDYTFTSGTIVFIDPNKLLSLGISSDHITSYDGYLKFDLKTLESILDDEFMPNLEAIMYTDLYGAPVSINFSCIDLVKSVAEYTPNTPAEPIVDISITESRYVYKLRYLDDDAKKELKTLFIDELSSNQDTREKQELYRSIFGTGLKGIEDYFIKGFNLLLSNFDVVTNQSENGISVVSQVKFTSGELDNPFKYDPIRDQTKYNNLTNTMINQSGNGSGISVKNDKIYWNGKLYKLSIYDNDLQLGTINYEAKICTTYPFVIKDTTPYNLYNDIINNNLIGTICNTNDIHNEITNSTNLDDLEFNFKVYTKVGFGVQYDYTAPKDGPYQDFPVYEETVRSSYLIKSLNSLKSVDTILDLSQFKTNENGYRKTTMNMEMALSEQQLLYYLMNSANATAFNKLLDNNLKLTNREEFVTHYNELCKGSTIYNGKKYDYFSTFANDYIKSKDDGFFNSLKQLFASSIGIDDEFNLQTYLTTYVLSAYELLQLDLSANYNDFIITNIDLKEQVQLGSLLESGNLVDETTFADVSKKAGKTALINIVGGPFGMIGTSIYNAVNDKTDTKKTTNNLEELAWNDYEIKVSDAPVGFYFVNNVTSDYTYTQTKISTQSTKITMDEYLQYASLIYDDNQKTGGISALTESDMAIINTFNKANRYFTPYFANAYSRGANYVSRSTGNINILNSINLRTNLTSFNAETEDFDFYSLKVKSYIAITDSVFKDNVFANDNGISKLTNVINVGKNADEGNDSTTVKVSSTGETYTNRAIIRSVGLVINDVTLITKSDSDKIAKAKLFIVASAIVIVVTTVALTIATGGAGSGLLATATSGLTKLAALTAGTFIHFVPVVLKFAVMTLRVTLALVKITTIVLPLTLATTLLTVNGMKSYYRDDLHFAGQVSRTTLTTTSNPRDYKDYV